MMTWDEIRELVRDKLVTIGAHSRTHALLAKLNDPDMCDEVAGSRARIEAVLGRPCRHFAYPYGSAHFAGPREFAATREAGFATAVTARRGLLYPEHRDRLAALPRIPLEGHMQDERLIEVQLSGAPFALRDGLRRRMA
jgi:peptidoglycan/xylan/chitin deacetylase (PgdA/CDA1 family)